MSDSMRAIVFEKFGEPAEVLRCQEVPMPVPKPGEVRVRMLASPVNPSDLMTVRGTYGRRTALPATPGYEGVGIVEANGGGLLGKFLQGKRVAVLNRQTGNWADYTIIPAKQAIPLSSRLPLEQAAMFFVNPATAYVMTREVLRLPNGGWLLQTAAGSALGRMVIRLGKHFGFVTINIVRRAEQVEELKSLGADEVLVFDGKESSIDDLRNEVRELTGNFGVGCAIDPVGGATGSAVIGCLGENGRLLVYGTLDDEPLKFSPRQLMTNGSKVEGFWLSRHMQSLGLLGKLKLVRKITQLMQAGILVSDVSQTYPLEDIAQAVTQSERPSRGGKILLRIGSEEQVPGMLDDV
jgi:NADPH:quinone reductase-like Zn-dependent oxidoreductase